MEFARRGFWGGAVLFFICILPFSASLVFEELWSVVDLDTGFVPAEEIQNISSFHLYALQPKHFSNLTGSDIATIALEHKDNEALFEKCLLAMDSQEQKDDFLKDLEDSDGLSEDVQSLIATSIIDCHPDLKQQWKFEQFEQLLKFGSPVLAYIPRATLFTMEADLQRKFLFHLRNWSWRSSRTLEWAKKSESVKRAWAEIIPLTKTTLAQLQLTSFLLTGCTPDELEKLLIRTVESPNWILDLPLDHMQARAVFASMSITKPKVSLERLAQFLPLLTPRQMKDYKVRNFSGVVAKEAFLKNMNNYISWASAAQIANLVLNEIGEADYIRDVQTVYTLGKWIFTVNSLQLFQVARLIEGLRGNKLDQAINAIDSPELSSQQARILINRLVSKSANPMGLVLEMQYNLLLGIPSAKIQEQAILPKVVADHLLSNLPALSTARFTLYARTRNMTQSSMTLKLMFDGRQGPERFANLMSIEEIRPVVWKLADLVRDSRHQKFWPPLFLRVVAHEIKDNVSGLDEWAAHLIGSPQLIAGLACEDMFVLGPDYGIPILVAFGNHLQGTNQKYPKDLRKCSLHAMISYLKKRAEIDPGKAEYLLNTLYPAEIAAIGGFPFTHLPYSIARKSKNWQHILKALSKLSTIELLDVLVLPGSTPMLMSHISKKMSSTKEVEIFALGGMGNLFQFVPFMDLLSENVDLRSMRLWLEGIERKTDTALCTTKAARASLWYRFIDSTYGQASKWSAGTVSTLGGLLIALPRSNLTQIPQEALLGAVDQLDRHLGYTPEFVKVCKRFLGPVEGNDFQSTLNALMRLLLNASSDLAYTVQSEKRSSESAPQKFHKISGFSPFSNNTTLKVYQSHNKKKRNAQFPELAKTLDNNTFKEERRLNSTKDAILCGAFKMSRIATVLTLQRRDLEALESSKELVDCLSFFGTLDLSASVIRIITDYVEEKKLKVDLRDIGKLASQADFLTVQSSELKNVDVIAALGYNLQSWELLDNITKLVLETNSINDSLPVELALNMGRLLCGDHVWTHNLMSPKIFIQIYQPLAYTLTSSPRCPPLTCLIRILKFAEQANVFGTMSSWSGDRVAMMGSIMAGLSATQLNNLAMHTDFISSLQSGAIRCLESASLKVLDEKLLSSLSQTALEALFFDRFGDLSTRQQSLVQKTLVSSPAHVLLADADYSAVETKNSKNQDSSSSNLVSNFSFNIICLFVVLWATKLNL